MNLRDEEAASREATLKTRTHIHMLEKEMHDAAVTMRKYRSEFEEMRGAVMLQQSIKAQQINMIAEQNERIEAAERSYEEELERAKQRVAEEVRAEWAPRLDATGAGTGIHSRTRGETKSEIGTSSRDTASSLSSWFRTTTAGRTSSIRGGKVKMKALEDAITQEEAEIKVLNKELTSFIQGGSAEVEEIANLEEVRKVQGELRNLWNRLDIPPEEIVSFLESLEVAVPCSEAVYDVYKQAAMQK